MDSESDCFFSPQSMIQIIMSERVMVLAGSRALLMQAAHPLAVAGLLAHSAGMADPYARLARTAQTMETITFGSRQEAERICAHVRTMHTRVRGTLPEAIGIYPAGTPYRADDPALLLWILYTLVDSAEVVYQTYIRPLSPPERAALWNDYRLVGQLFGLQPEQMPADVAALDAYGQRMLGGAALHVGPWARRRATSIIMHPPVPLWAQPLLRTINFITIALLPDEIRWQYQFSGPPAGIRAVLVAAGALGVRRNIGIVPAGWRRRQRTPLLHN